MKLRIPDIELYNMSRYRGELMGAAMLFIILFHVGLNRWDPFFGLRRTGNVGVDMFLFLSGIGLWYSWTKKKKKAEAPAEGDAPAETAEAPRKEGWHDIWSFYLRRFIRIYPAWLIVAGLYYIPKFHGDWLTLIGELAININFWRYGELAFWYIPAIMALYLIAPFYMMLIERHPMYRWIPLITIIWCIMVEWVLPLHDAVNHLEIFWSRVPIFLIGINFGKYVKEKHTIDGQAVWMLIVMWLLTFGTCLYLEQIRHGDFPLFVERMLYIPFTVMTIMLLNRVFRRTPRWFNTFFAFVGTVSLEAYLIHIHFVLCYVELYHLGYWLTFVITVAITLPLAWLLHKMTNLIIPGTSSRKKKTVTPTSVSPK
jgi:peptidoglycan/LPS O-acetylase OafA/YrhL